MGTSSPGLALRNRLIGDTVRSAGKGSTFYGALYRGADLAAIKTVDDLAVLPTVDKRALMAAGPDALCPAEAGPTIAIQNTSGTTGAAFWLHRSQAEQAFISTFFTEWLSDDAGAAETPPPFVLQLMSDRHGVPTAVPSNVFPFSCRLMDRASLQKAVELLAATFDVNGAKARISVVTGAHDDIVMLTNHLLEAGIDPKTAFAVTRVSPIGRYLTRRLRDALAGIWGARIAQRYSLAEIFGGANWVDSLGAYVFDPYVVPEVLSLESGAPLTEGIGRLHLTSLKPFSILQPFIRYRTGDLFEAVAGPDGLVLHRFCGREVHALFHPLKPDTLLASGLAVLEALDPHPDFHREPFAADLGVADRCAAGWPRSRGEVAVEGGRFAVRIAVETRSEMGLFPERAEALRRSVVEKLLAEAPALAACVARGEARVELAFATPGALAELERTSAFWRREAA